MPKIKERMSGMRRERCRRFGKSVRAKGQSSLISLTVKGHIDGLETRYRSQYHDTHWTEILVDTVLTAPIVHRPHKSSPPVIS